MKVSDRLTKLLHGDNESAEVPGVGENASKHEQNKAPADLVKNEAGRACPIPAADGARPSILMLARLVLAVALLVTAHFLKEPSALLVTAIQIAAAAIAGYDLVLKAANDIKAGLYIREALPILAAVILSFAISRGLEGTIAIIIFQLAVILRGYAYCRVKGALIDDASSTEEEENLLSGGETFTGLEAKISRFSEIFAPAMLVVGVLVIIIVTFAVKDAGLSEAIRRAVTVIAISSPCGVLLSIPLSLMTGMSAAELVGFRFKDANALDNSAGIGALVFEKSGTITDYEYKVTSIQSDKMDPATFLKVAAHAASVGNGAIYNAIIDAYAGQIDPYLVQKFYETPGSGVSVLVDSIEILLGTDTFLADNGAKLSEADRGLTVYMTVSGQYAGKIILGDSLNPAIKDTLLALSDIKIHHISMLSSDTREKDRATAAVLNIAEYYAECAPEDRVKHLREIKGRLDKNHNLAYVARGLGYDKALVAADVGIVLGVENDSSAVRALTLDTNLAGLPIGLAVARRTRLYTAISMLVGFGIKIILAALAMFGFAPIWFGLIIDSCVSVGLLIYCLSKSRLSLGGKA